MKTQEDIITVVNFGECHWNSGVLDDGIHIPDRNLIIESMSIDVPYLELRPFWVLCKFAYNRNK